MVPHEQLLTVVVAVDFFAFSRIDRLHKSLALNLPDFKISIEVLVLRFTAEQGVLYDQLHPSVTIFHATPDILPIVHSRNLCQRHLQMLMQSNGGVGMVLDDDLLWTLSQKKFLGWLNQLEAGSCAMALMGTGGDPPIPREYLRAAPLLDFLFHLIESELAPCSVRRYLDGFTRGTSQPKHAHHDYYVFKRNGFSPTVFELCVDEFFCRLDEGKCTTRSASFPNEILRCSGRYRGGATLVLDYRVLNELNASVKLGNCVSRRSDMVMATRVVKAGFLVYQTPVALEHCRQSSFDSADPVKLVADILGCAYVEHLQSEKSLQELAVNRIRITRNIIIETSKMLSLCADLDMVSDKCLDCIGSMLHDNARLLESLIAFEVEFCGGTVVSLPPFPDQRN